MIPKILHFIWLGNIPDYAYFCVRMFKQINPEFKINFVTEQNINNITNQDIIELINILKFDQSTFYHDMMKNNWKFYPFMNEYKNRDSLEKLLIGNLTLFTDILRFYLLNKYGGIYLDCDTFPVKPFDQDLLDKNNFVVSHSLNKEDIFFMGSTKYCIDNKIIYTNPVTKLRVFSDKVYRLNYLESIINLKHRKNLNKIKQNFRNCNIQYGFSFLNKSLSDYYIDHYRLENWRSKK